jgi:hypothetical protein
MSEIITTKATRVELVDPSEAGRLDPSMQDWLVLPESDTGCPECGSTYWGTKNPSGYFLVRYCKDEHGQLCKAEWRAPVDPQTIGDVVDALLGVKRRFWRGNIK